MSKKFNLIAILLFSVVYVFSQNSAKPENLTKPDFLKKIANYESSPDTFVYLGDKPCIIEFYANWCAPCRRIAPILETLAKEYAGKIYVYKINVDKEKELAALFGIQSIPSILFVPKKDTPQMAVGLIPKETFVKAIDEILLK
ncbi:MAG: thioredoxin [Prevotellaceae bacterium]|nr:thioredoxin [Prevotellaceae bacterium]